MCHTCTCTVCAINNVLIQGVFIIIQCHVGDNNYKDYTKTLFEVGVSGKALQKYQQQFMQESVVLCEWYGSRTLLAQGPDCLKHVHHTL